MRGHLTHAQLKVMSIEADPARFTRQCLLPSSLVDCRHGWRMADPSIGGHPNSSRHHARRQNRVQSVLSGPPSPVGNRFAPQRAPQHAHAAPTALPKSP
jgi:hypothetical protein